MIAVVLAVISLPRQNISFADLSGSVAAILAIEDNTDCHLLDR